MDTKSIFTKTFQKKPAEKPAKKAAPALEATEQIAAPVVPKPPKSASKPPVRRETAAAESRATMFDSENIVRAIHKSKEENQRITVDVPLDIYRSMKVHLAQENVSIRDFVVRLIDVYLTKNQIR